MFISIDYHFIGFSSLNIWLRKFVTSSKYDYSPSRLLLVAISENCLKSLSVAMSKEELSPNLSENVSVLLETTVFESLPLMSVKLSGKITSRLKFNDFRISCCKNSTAKLDLASTNPPGNVPCMLK